LVPFSAMSSNHHYWKPLVGLSRVPRLLDKSLFNDRHLANTVVY
jgi:hypothetical protein